MRKFVIVIAVIAALYLDMVLFDILGIKTIAPDVMIAVLTALGVLIGGVPVAAIGICIGLLLDILSNLSIGLSSLFFGFSAAIGGFFHKKFYADNPVIPALAAAGIVFIREHIMLAFCAIVGRNMVKYFVLLLTHILPCSILTGIVCAVVYFVLKNKAMHKPMP